MHELSICESLVTIMEEEAERQKFTRVKRVCLEIGPFSGVEIDALRFSFEIAVRGTVAEDAVLDIEQPQTEAKCMVCGNKMAVEDHFAICPHCGSGQLQASGGNMLRIRALEVI
ncbi:hydrogenase maturation nickel metallochaperone HypA [Martelella lutilitoris]|uniref:Hydrogenase maturation factor HypA n=2 Tax=Martelella lutilitoris TaxID=2583532 RepID=A0A5C4JLG9_9HYPH|nr:hydrogenase maturation nickel metallochaperone HypA [Martelella lutilitoris]